MGVETKDVALAYRIMFSVSEVTELSPLAIRQSGYERCNSPLHIHCVKGFITKVPIMPSQSSGSSDLPPFSNLRNRRSFDISS